MIAAQSTLIGWRRRAEDSLRAGAASRRLMDASRVTMRPQITADAAAELIDVADHVRLTLPRRSRLLRPHGGDDRRLEQ